MTTNDDSRALTGDEPTETMTLEQIIAGHKSRNIGLIHGDRYTYVYGWATTRDGVTLLDCYGDEIPGGYGRRSVPARVVAH